MTTTNTTYANDFALVDGAAQAAHNAIQGIFNGQLIVMGICAEETDDETIKDIWLDCFFDVCGDFTGMVGLNNIRLGDWYELDKLGCDLPEKEFLDISALLYPCSYDGWTARVIGCGATTDRTIEGETILSVLRAFNDAIQPPEDGVIQSIEIDEANKTIIAICD